MPSKHTDTQKQAAVEHARNLITNDGLTANQATATAGDKAGVTGRTVYRWADKLSIDLGAQSRDAAQNAAAVHAAHYAARREQVRLRFLEVIEHVIARVHQPHYEWKVAKGGVVRVDYDEAPDGAVKNYVTAAAIALDKIRLEEGKATSRHAGLPPLADVEAMIAEAEAAKADA